MQKIALKIKRKKYRIRNKMVSRGSKLRVSAFRSLNHVYAQIIDDNAQKTLMSLSSLNLSNAQGTKSEIAKQVGLELAKKAVKDGITEVFFDRGQFLYHGRIRAIAEGLREGGLQF